MTRCFVGFELSEDSRDWLRERLLPLHRALADERGWPLRLVPPENWHATLLFFPELDEAERAAVWGAVEGSVADGAWRGLAFDWQRVAIWPGPRRPSLLCVEAAPYAGAAAWPLAARLEEPPFAKGETEHLRRYVPHITVMRFRKGRDKRLPRPRDWQAAQALLPAIDAAALRFDRVSFFLSTVSPQQPIYPRERTLPLAP
jgi:2'-5' RNA ligase